QVQTELASDGYEVSAVTKWWGFEVHLNAKAAQAAADITEKIGSLLAKIPKLKPLAPLIKAYCKIRAAWIRRVGATHGCKLVSPWIAPGMLIPISLGPKEDASLWWTVYQPDKGWNEDQKFPGHMSASNPALAVFNGKLYAVHRGYTDRMLWWTVYDPSAENGWADDTNLPQHFSDDGPALAV
ncbi:hypothetical protein ACW9HQ_50615, partial [Nocardia gipuzkoensis]